MLDEAFTADDITTQRRYSTFSARVRAMVIDAFIVVSAMVVGMLVLDAVETELAGRLYAIMIFGLVFLYDPLLVSATGGTLGHRVMNIRVVDRDAERRIGLGRALLRTALKTVLGFLSFFFLAVTRRHQALHDVVTRSVVIVNDVSRAKATDYVLASEALVVGVPAVLRVVMILVYSVAWLFLNVVAVWEFVSRDCMLADRCTAVDDGILTAIGLVLMLGIGTLVVLGWKGRLPGARRRPGTPPELVPAGAANNARPLADVPGAAQTPQPQP